jgi:triacylglycerol esterase/lipase EstA (alpha/beta hydrolase family)
MIDPPQLRFLSPDDPVLYWSVEDPQTFNLYSYVHNNPLNHIDPTGHLTIIVPGTGWSSSNWNDNMKLVNEAKQEFHDPDVRILNWSGDLTNSARLQGASQLSEMVANHTFQPGEKLNVIGHSRGGEVALDATTNLTHKIDNLITLGAC